MSKELWDRWFREGVYSQNPDPPRVLEQYVDWFPDGRALDVATGTGRLSVFLATRGYAVDAIDQSREGLRVARQRAADRGVEANWLQADAGSFVFPQERYDLVTIRSYRALDRLTDITDALKQDGVLFYQDHLRTTEPMTSGPLDDRSRVGANELLRACLGLTVIHYKEFTAEKDSGELDAYAQVIARKSNESAQPLPRRRTYQD